MSMSLDFASHILNVQSLIAQKNGAFSAVFQMWEAQRRKGNYDLNLWESLGEISTQLDGLELQLLYLTRLSAEKKESATCDGLRRF